MTRLVLAADFGGTHLRAAIVDERGEVLFREDHPTPPQASPGEAVQLVVDLLARTVEASGAAPAAACIATAGLINANEGKVIFAPNIAGFRNVVLTTPVAQRLGIPAYIENDASAAALGEYRFGAGRGTRHLLHATLGTGIGGGIVIDGRLYRGAQGLAGEIGHIIIDPAGPRCTCGSRGCLEALVSGVAFAARARKLLEQGKSAVLKELVGYAEPTAVHLFEAAKRGDRTCEAEIRNGGHILGLGLGSLVNVLNPDAVTLSGGLLAMGEMLLGPMREAMGSMAYGPASGALVRIGELGENTGLLGAAAVAFERLEGD
ncbi:ROK family protein [Tepidiforma thermophila]|uniref:Glucokinase n=1 Tax=Tepidiforma thermophila (strain KCTC 52669 / CGMCC 1.13589 / G233) TaxID=2761530 RepID=A0A2A9HE85_TEPT2|nr:ROK family protein [Tepidiforma thermophila]PFG74118.1 glucokinase [Tepidiforma thermophila]